MNEIGELFRLTREEAGVSITEASKDLEIKESFLENIEDGNIGCFKDIFVLKDYIVNYSKYLGIDSDRILNEFNEYMFEYTSKIPLDEIEREIEEQNPKTNKKEVLSPYTKASKKYNKSLYVFLYTCILLLVLVVTIWSVRQITVSKETANVISYVK